MSWLIIADVLVRIIGYTMILYGIWLLVGQYVIADAITYISQDIKRRRYIKRLNRINKVDTYEEKEKSFFHAHIQTLMNAVNKKNDKSLLKNEPINLYILSLFLFSITFSLILLATRDFMISLLFGALLMSTPYLILRVRLINKRMKTSMSFLNNFHIIVQSYSSSGKSAYHMVQTITEELEDKELKNTFIKLLASMQQDRSEKDFREAIKVFSYTINSSFAIRLGNLIAKAHLESADISLPLSDLNSDVTARKADLENERSLNVETKILGYLPIITMPLFIFAAWRLSSMYNFWTLFNQKVTLLTFFIAVVLTLFSFFAVIVFMKPRSDI